MKDKLTAERLLARMERNWPEALTPMVKLMVRVYRLNDLALENAQRQTERHGLSFTEFEVLLTLRSAGPPYQLAPTALYSAVLISSGGLTKVLYSLEERRLVARIKNKSDGRSSEVRLTAAGKRLAEVLIADVHQADGALFAKALAHDDMTQLIALMRKLLMAIEAEA
jgi:DNA-binding MarR family transcriptional regulator